MSNTWTFREDVSRVESDLTGFDVEALDGSIGNVDEDTPDASHLIVDTGFWIFGKRRLLPAGAVIGVDGVERKVFVNLTKDQIKDAPDLDESADRASGDWNRDQYETYYQPYIW